MHVHRARTDVTYEVFFKKPLLDSRSGPPLIESVFDALNENFAAALNDVVVNPGPNPSLMSVLIRMFQGAGSIELRLDRWRGHFRNIVSEDDMNLVVRCLSATSGALPSNSDRLTPTRAITTMANWYACNLDVPELRDILGKYWFQGNELKLGFLDAEQIEVSLNPRFKNSTEGWDALFHVQPSLLAGTQLFLNFTGTYIFGGRYNTIEHQLDHAQTAVKGMLEKIDFELTV